MLPTPTQKLDVGQLKSDKKADWALCGSMAVWALAVRQTVVSKPTIINKTRPIRDIFGSIIEASFRKKIKV
jgi:hypothetical protein